MRCEPAVAITAKEFELKAECVGRLMRDQYRLGVLDVGGWDTHVNSGGAQGALAANVESLGHGLRVFLQTLGAEWRTPAGPYGKLEKNAQVSIAQFGGNA